MTLATAFPYSLGWRWPFIQHTPLPSTPKQKLRDEAEHIRIHGASPQFFDWVEQTSRSLSRFGMPISDRERRSLAVAGLAIMLENRPLHALAGSMFHDFAAALRSDEPCVWDGKILSIGSYQFEVGLYSQLHALAGMLISFGIVSFELKPLDGAVNMILGAYAVGP